MLVLVAASCAPKSTSVPPAVYGTVFGDDLPEGYLVCVPKHGSFNGGDRACMRLQDLRRQLLATRHASR